MTTITREWLQQTIAEYEANRDELPFGLDTNSAIELQAFKLALASLEAEPYGYVHKAAYEEVGSCGLSNDHEAYRDSSTHIAVYTAPPAPVVPDAHVTAEHRRVIQMLLSVCGAAFELADDSCQQDIDGESCHVVPDNSFKKLSDALDEIENTLPTEDVDRPNVFLAWSAMPRAVLKSILQASNSPVAPDCWCHTCRPVTMGDMRFVVCPECGNKRCPHTNDHNNACIGSNEPGQEGSAYPAAPQQEAE